MEKAATQLTLNKNQANFILVCSTILIPLTSDRIQDTDDAVYYGTKRKKVARWVWKSMNDY
jgi:hypothetical protein